MTRTDREQYVRGMLSRFRDSLSQGSLGPSLEGFDSRLLLLPREHNQAMRELDRCLGVMRGSEPVLRFHTLAWYVDVHYRQVPRFLFVVTRTGKRRIPAGWELKPVRHRDVDEKRAERGVAWIAGEYQWSRVHLKSILEAAGEGLAA